VASPKAGFRTVAELIAAAKAKPGVLTYGSAGVGSGSHLAGELFNQAANINTLHVPYKGSGPATAGIASGEVDFTLTSQAGTLGLHQAGKVFALAITGTAPSPLFPNVPTTAAAGLKDFEAGDWIGVFVPAGTPKAVIARIDSALAKWLSLPGTEAQLGQAGFVGRHQNSAQFAGLVRSELAKWGKATTAAGIKPE
jgi:tripartite-type tricarboxylate transporter receptor subunit TctC